MEKKKNNKQWMTVKVFLEMSSTNATGMIYDLLYYIDRIGEC